MEFVVKAGGWKQTIRGVGLFLGHQGSIDATCWWMCQHWPLSPFLFCVFCCIFWGVFLFSFFVSGKSPAGPVCGITPQDPSRAGSQKRKQLSDNELLCCDQTSAFARSGWGSWECVKNHTLTRSLVRFRAHGWMQTLFVNFVGNKDKISKKKWWSWSTFTVWTEHWLVSKANTT